MNEEINKTNQGRNKENKERRREKERERTIKIETESHTEILVGKQISVCPCSDMLLKVR
jgi:hypothetical protein